MSGVIATLLAVALIAALMIIGIRTRLPPLDPDWREHLPKPPPPPPIWWWVLWLGRYPVMLATIIAGASKADVLVTVLVTLLVLMTIGGIVARRIMLRAHRRRDSPELA